jgi:Plasma-membrane choline transporter
MSTFSSLLQNGGKVDETDPSSSPPPVVEAWNDDEEEELPPPMMMAIPIIDDTITSTALLTVEQEEAEANAMILNTVVQQAQIVTIDDDDDDHDHDHHHVSYQNNTNTTDVTPLLPYPTGSGTNRNNSNNNDDDDQNTVYYEEQDDQDNKIMNLSCCNNKNDENDSFCSDYRDWPFALAFWLHIILILVLGRYLAPLGYDAATAELDLNVTHWQEAILEQNAKDKNTDFNKQDWDEFVLFVSQAKDYLQIYPQRILLYLVIPSIEVGLCTILLVTLWIVRPGTKWVVLASVWGPWVVTVLAMMGMVYMVQTIPSLIVAVLLVGGITYFCRLLSPMIPFATVNLKVALHGISANGGTYVWAFVFSELAVTWVLFWMYTTFGVLSYEGSICDTSTTSSTMDTAPDGGSVPWHRMLHKAMSSSSSSSSSSLPTSNTKGGWDDDDDDDMGDGCGRTKGLTFLFFLVSLFWTSTVILVRFFVEMVDYGCIFSNTASTFQCY